MYTVTVTVAGKTREMQIDGSRQDADEAMMSALEEMGVETGIEACCEKFEMTESAHDSGCRESDG